MYLDYRKVFILSLMAAPTLFAQISEGQATVPAENSEWMDLSPFEVKVERNQGFAAASALAGGRLATDLRDTPAAFSVATKDFLEALSLKDLQSAAVWMTGTVEAPDNGQQLFFANPVYYVVRGTRASRQQRNYFPQFNDLDSYNIERYDFGRGPNSILFGNGTLGGVASATTLRPDPRRAAQRVVTTYGAWNARRLTVDINQPISSTAALRGALLWSDSDAWRDKDFDRRKAAFLSGLWRPFKGTELRLEAEVVRNEKQIGFTILNDMFSGWDGITTFNTPMAGFGLSSAVLSQLQAKGISRMGDLKLYNPSSGEDAIVNMQYTPVTLAGGSTGTTPIAGFVSGSSSSYNTAGANILYEQNVPDARFAHAIAGSAFRLPSAAFTISPDAPLITQHFKDLQFTLSQRIGRLQLELAADTNRAVAFVNGEQNRGTNTTYIDINSVLPSGAPNTHFLQPYGEGQFFRSYRGFNYDNLRGAAAMEWRPMGMRISANLLGGINLGRDDVDYQYLSLTRNTDHRYWEYEYISIRRYWNESNRALPELDQHTVRFIDPVSGVVSSVTPHWIPDKGRTDTEAINRSNYKYALASLNVKLFKERLIILGAVRRDAYYFYSSQQVRPGDYPVDWDGKTVIFKPDAPAEYLGLKYQSRDANGMAYGPLIEAINRPRNGILRDVRYANDRFKDDYNAPALSGAKLTKSYGGVLHLFDWFSPFFNYAETFNPPNFTTRINGSLMDPTIATGIDYGLRFEFWQRRLDLRVTRYQNHEINSMIGSDGPGYFNILYDANVVGDLTSYGRNARGIAPLPIQYRDTRTRDAEGIEFELTINPTRALRFTANVTLPKVYESEMNPDVRAYILQNAELFKQIAQDAGVLINPITNLALVDTSVPAAQRSPDAGAAAAAYNDIYGFAQSIVIGKRINQDQPVINVFGDYTFQQGILKHLRAGLGVRYRGRQIVGNKGSDTIVDPSNPNKAIDDPSVDAYTPLYSPKGYTILTATLARTWKLTQGRMMGVNLVVDNLLNDRGPIYSSTAQVASLLRPKDNDYTSPARVAVPRYYGLKQPLSFSLSVSITL